MMNADNPPKAMRLRARQLGIVNRTIDGLRGELEETLKKLKAIVEGAMTAEGMFSPCSICRPSDEYRHQENCPILDAERFLSKLHYLCDSCRNGQHESCTGILCVCCRGASNPLDITLAHVRLDNTPYLLAIGPIKGNNLRETLRVNENQHLWEECDKDDALVPEDGTEITLRDGMSFYTASKQINQG